MAITNRKQVKFSELKMNLEVFWFWYERHIWEGLFFLEPFSLTPVEGKIGRLFLKLPNRTPWIYASCSSSLSEERKGMGRLWKRKKGSCVHHHHQIHPLLNPLHPLHIPFPIACEWILQLGQNKNDSTWGESRERKEC